MSTMSNGVPPAPGTAPTNGAPASTENKPPQGVIIPPPELRSKIDKTAAFVAVRPPNFIHQLTATPETAAKFAFALEDNPFYPYLRWQIQEYREGRGGTGAGGKAGAAGSANQGPPEPPKFKFSARMPNISAIDLDIIKTTAVFVAKHGRQWMIHLSQRENQNPQFNFLRPAHTLHGFFTLLVDQYRDLMTGGSLAGGESQRLRIEELKANVANKSAILEKAKLRATYYKHKEDKRAKEAASKEAEQRAYKEIDWDDFVVVGTIEFTEADDDVELPAPTSLSELQSASLEQKAAFSIPVDRRLEETQFDDPMFFGADPSSLPAAQVTAATAQPPQPSYTPQPFYPQQYPQYPPAYPAPYMPAASPVNAAQSPYPAPFAPSPGPQAAAPGAPPGSASGPAPFTAPGTSASPAPAPGQPPMRIRNDYVPRAQARRQNAPTVLCPICNQQILESEYANHVKIEQLDPSWRQQNAAAAANRSGMGAGANNAGLQVAANLKRLSSQRQEAAGSASASASAAGAGAGAGGAGAGYAGAAAAGAGGEVDGGDRKRIETRQGVGSAVVPGQVGGVPGAGAGAGTGAGQGMDVQEQIRHLQNRYSKESG